MSTKLINKPRERRDLETVITEVAAGLLATRGKRSIYLLGTSTEVVERYRNMLASYTFAALWRGAKPAPQLPNTRLIKWAPRDYQPYPEVAPWN